MQSTKAIWSVCHYLWQTDLMDFAVVFIVFAAFLLTHWTFKVGDRSNIELIGSWRREIFWQWKRKVGLSNKFWPFLVRTFGWSSPASYILSLWSLPYATQNLPVNPYKIPLPLFHLLIIGWYTFWSAKDMDYTCPIQPGKNMGHVYKSGCGIFMKMNSLLFWYIYTWSFLYLCSPPFIPFLSLHLSSTWLDFHDPIWSLGVHRALHYLKWAQRRFPAGNSIIPSKLFLLIPLLFHGS